MNKDISLLIDSLETLQATIIAATFNQNTFDQQHG